MFKPVGNIQTNNAKRIIKWAYGQMRLGRPEPVWFDCVARLHPPLSFASAPTGHRFSSVSTSMFKPEKIVFPEDGLRRQESRAKAKMHEPIGLVNHNVDNDGQHTASPVYDEAERLSREFLQEEAAALDQAVRLERLKQGNRRK